MRASLGLREPSELSDTEYFNNSTGPNGAQAQLFYAEPSAQVLTFVNAWGQHETGWSIAAPTRTAAASNIDSDLFARGLVAGRFFGFEMVLILPDACSVGALGDALGATAYLRAANAGSGIFHPATMTAAQDVLVKNGAKLMVRVTSNKKSTSVEAALAATTCSTANLAACSALLADLDAASIAFAQKASSDLAKLEDGTDPTWSTVEVVSGPVAILSP